MADPWPAEVPSSLWTYNQLAAEELGQVPMMGVKFASGFLYAFAFGCAFIAIFAWNRFRATTEVRSASRALTELGPSDIGGHAALIRAYFIYAGAILVLYISLTFFGKLLFQMMTMVPAIGFSVDTDELRFDNAQWPLMLAFGFAGLAQMLPPVAAIEGWLRRRAYRAVGIPVRLEQTMRNLIVTLERAGPQGDLRDTDLGKELANYRAEWQSMIHGHAWARNWAEQRPTGENEIVSMVAQLELLVSWSKHKRGSWPGNEVSQAVRDRERNYIAETEALLTELQQRLSESPEDDGDGSASARRGRFGDYLAGRIKAAEALRFDLLGILAIFLERDIDSPDVIEDNSANKADESYTDPALRTLLQARTRSDSAGTGPESGLFVTLFAIFVISAAAVWRGLQEPVGPFVETGNLYGVLASGLVETLRIASLTWLPLLAAFSLRQFWWDNGDWAKARYSTQPNHYAAQIVTCLSLGIAAGLLGLAGVAALKAFFIATNREHFNALLFSGGAPFMLFYPTQAIVLPALIPLAIHSADLRTNDNRLLMGLVAALAVGTLSLAHARFWDPLWGQDCMTATTFLTNVCQRRLDAVGHVVLMAMAFLAVGFFGDMPARRRSFGSGRGERERPARPGVAALALVAVLALLPAPVRAQAPSAVQPQAGTPDPVTIGFRQDIAPFSFQTKPDGPFHGYLANLCFDLFDGEQDYAVKVQPVNAKNRFQLFNDRKVDILCDAVTMRFSDDARSEKGIYSPIVFVSGVSYLKSVSRSVGSIWLGFVRNATARDVARKTCHVDQFRVFMPDSRVFLAERCNLRWQAALLAENVKDVAERPKPSSTDDEERLKRDWVKLQDDWVRLHATADNLKRLAGDPETPRFNADTSRLIKTITDANKDIASCADDGRCDSLFKVASQLSDRTCDKDYALPPSHDEKRTTVEQRPWDEYHFCPKEDHASLIQWFCASRTDARRVYLGDRELIVAKRDAWVKDVGSCPVERSEGAEFLSYEPYALLVRRDNPKLVAFVQRRIYELFSDRNRMTERFSTSFPERTMSKPLAYLFLLNAVEDDTLFLPVNDTPEAGAPTPTAPPNAGPPAPALAREP